MNTRILIAIGSAGIALLPAAAAVATETSTPVHISLNARAADAAPVMRGTDRLVVPTVAPLHGGSSAQAGQLGFDTDVQCTTVSLAGHPGILGVRSDDGGVQYAVRLEGAAEPVKSDLAPKPFSRSYTRLQVPVPGSDKPVDLYVRAAGNPARFIRYFVPQYYEGTWQSPGGDELRVALFPAAHTASFPSISDATLMVDFDADGVYKAKDPTIEKIDSSRPFRIAGTTYRATADTAARELVLTPVDEHATELQAMRVGAKAPDFTAEDTDGKKIKLSDFRGKFVFFDVWATWCGPCIAEIPNLQKAHEKHGKDVVVLGVSIDGDKQTAVDYTKKEKLTYPQVWQPEAFQSEVCKLYQVNGIPSTFLVDPEGNLAGISIRSEEIEKALEMAAKYDQPEAKQFFREKQEMGRLMAQVENLQSLGKDDRAIAMLKEYLAANPNSPSTEMIERWLDHLKEE